MITMTKVITRSKNTAVTMMNMNLNKLRRKKFLWVTKSNKSKMPLHELQISIDKIVITIRNMMLAVFIIGSSLA